MAKAQEKYTNVFGSISHLKDEMPWTTGLSNMMEYLQWETSAVLGISKAKLIKDVLKIAGADDRETAVNKELEKIRNESDIADRYALPKESYCTPREALRRGKFFSEDYFNKEFDVFMSLCSDEYLDSFYRQFYPKIKGGHRWSTHGNSGLYSYSTGISEMSMDNLAYNDSECLLIANELKLGGKKNKDQLLKYAYMWRMLETKGFIKPGCHFVLLFISDKNDSYDKKRELEQEIFYCNEYEKSKLIFTNDQNIKKAEEMTLACISWEGILRFNTEYLKTLGHSQQVESKLLNGFNESIASKHFMQKSTVIKK
jgi:hypothetical protein